MITNTRKWYSEIVLLHCIGVIMIFVCHVAKEFNNSFLGELLASGIPLFMFVSGFLAGNKEVAYDRRWIKRKSIRILLPFYLVLIVVFAIYIAWGGQVIPKQWLVLLTNTQGLTNFVFINDTMGYWSPLAQGLGHLWFVTVIMICYLLVPVVNTVYNTFNWLKENIGAVLIIMVFLVEPYLLFYNMRFGNIVIFFIGFFFARKQVKMSHKLFCFSTLATIVLCLLRFIAKIFIDGTFIYNYYISDLSNLAIGLWLVMLLFYLRFLSPGFVDKIAAIKAVVWLESTIYEIYLIHHIIIKGSWSFYKFGYNPILTTVVILAVTVCLSLLLKLTTNLLVSKVFKK